MAYDALGQWDGEGGLNAPTLPTGWSAFNGETPIWTGGGAAPINSPWDASNATRKFGTQMTAKQVQDEFDALPASEKAIYSQKGVNPVSYYNANGTTIQPGNLSNTLQWQTAIENTPSFKGEGQGGLGSLLGMMGGDLGPFIAASLAAAGATGGLGSLFGSGASSGGFGSGFIDSIGSGVGAGGSITGALPAVGGSMDWIDAIGGMTDSTGTMLPGYSGAPSGTSWLDGLISSATSGNSSAVNLIKSLAGGSGSGGTGGNSLLGTLLGGLLGSTNGSKQAGSTTVTQEPWAGQQPYLLDAFNKAKQAANGTPLQTQANSNYSSVLSGPTKNPMLGMDNPYLTKAIDYANEDVTRAMMPAMNQANKAAGSFGNSGVADTYSNALTNQYGKNATGMRMTDYTNQQNLQQQAVNNTLGFTSNANNYAAQPSQNYAQTVQGNYGGQTTTPYYTNPLSGIMGGAMVGNQIGSNLGF